MQSYNPFRGLHLKKSEVDSAKRLWDAGTDTPRVIEPRSVAHGKKRERRKKKKKGKERFVRMTLSLLCLKWST